MQDIYEKEKELVMRVEAAQKLVDSANRALRAHRNNHGLNKEPVWPNKKEEKRQRNIEQNGNTGEHYE